MSKSVERNAYLHLVIVYVIWGSTFVAMRAAVMGNSGFPPFSVGASRLGAASLLLFSWALLRKMSLRLSKHDLWVSAISGVIIWVAGNGLTMWSEQWVDAGYAALVFSTVTIWTAIFGNILDRKLPSLRLWGAFIIASIGMGVLGGANLFHANKEYLKPTLAMLFGTMLWGMSTHLQKREPVSCSRFVSSAYQQLFGSLGFLMMALLMREPFPHPTHVAWISWGYLVFFGSIIAFSSYVEVVRVFSPTIAMTFAYVCPVLAVIFGALILHEPIGINKLIGMILILSAVFLIFNDKKEQK